MSGYGALAARDQADMQEAVRLVCGCGCPTCVSVVSALAEDGSAWEAVNPPCKVKRSPGADS